MTSHWKLLTWLLPVLTGLLMALACPPVNLFFLAWVGIIPLIIVLEKEQTGGFRIGFIAGVAYGLGTLYWLAFNSGTHPAAAALTAVAAACTLASGWGVASFLFVFIRKRIGKAAWLLLPFSWTAWEGWLSYAGEVAFPWSITALSQADFEPLLQIMEFTGVWGVSFWVVSLNTALFFVWRNRVKMQRRLAFVGITLLILIPPLAQWHAYSYYNKDYPVIRVMVVQGNIPASIKWEQGPEYSWAVYDSLMRDGAKTEIDLAVWPETAVPARIPHQSLYSTSLTTLARQTGSAILTGASDYTRTENGYRPLNGAFLVTPVNGIVDRYAKQYLVPLGERVPFQWLIPYLGTLNLGQAEFLPGARQTLFQVSTDNAVARFPALICYESIYSSITRSAVNGGANLLVIISNDGWYGRSAEPYQISALSRYRCIETRRAMARASNSGISSLFDPLGRQIASTEMFEPAWKAAELPLCSKVTFYVRHGNVFLALSTLIYGIGLLFALYKDIKLRQLK